MIKVIKILNFFKFITFDQYVQFTVYWFQSIVFFPVEQVFFYQKRIGNHSFHKIKLVWSQLISNLGNISFLILVLKHRLILLHLAKSGKLRFCFFLLLTHMILQVLTLLTLIIYLQTQVYVFLEVFLTGKLTKSYSKKKSVSSKFYRNLAIGPSVLFILPDLKGTTAVALINPK